MGFDIADISLLFQRQLLLTKPAVATYRGTVVTGRSLFRNIIHSGTPVFFSFFFLHPIYYLPSFLSLLVVTQIRDHIAGSSPPPSPLRTVQQYDFFFFWYVRTLLPLICQTSFR